MHQEDDHYDDDYDDSQDNLDSPYKHYFKFDPDAWDAWGKMLYDTLSGIVEYPSNVWYVGSSFPKKSLPVNSWNPNADKEKSFQYLGSNYQGQPIWKNKYFICDPINTLDKKHVESNAVHFINQPHYYKGLFDILN